MAEHERTPHPSDLFGAVRIGEPLAYAGLQVFPLDWPNGHDPNYALLDELLERGEVEIGEVDQGGHVPTIRLLNRSNRDVFVFDGTELRGAKQNRMINITIIAGARDVTDIPVTCVEAGRWEYRGRRFTSTGRTVASKLRRAKTFEVRKRFTTLGVAAADQHRVWETVRSYLDHSGVRSSTEALDDAFAHRQRELADLVDQLSGLEAHGAAVALGGELIALDLFDHQHTFRRLWGLLLRGYAMDALLEGGGLVHRTTREDVEALMTRVRTTARLRRREVPGVGQYWTLQARDVAGGVVMHGGRVVHAAVFTAPLDEVRA